MLNTLNTLDPNNPNPQIVETRIIGTSLVVYSAWQLDGAGSALDSGYSTITYVEGGRFGRLGTERLPADLDALKGDERYARVREWQRAKYQRAYDLIAGEVDLPLSARFDMGEAEVRDAA